MLNIAVFPIGPLSTNSYLVYDEKEALAVDVGGSPEPMLDFLMTKNLKLGNIFCTHLHFDHTYGVAELSRQTGAEIYASKDDFYMLEDDFGRGGKWGLPSLELFVPKPLPLGKAHCLDGRCEVLKTPGHTPGGLSFYFADGGFVISGDTLFHRSVGRTDFPRGDLNALMHSIHTQLFTLPGNTRVYAGHGEPTTIAEEKLGNPFTGEFTF